MYKLIKRSRAKYVTNIDTCRGRNAKARVIDYSLNIRIIRPWEMILSTLLLLAILLLYLRHDRVKACLIFNLVCDMIDRLVTI